VLNVVVGNQLGCTSQVVLKLIPFLAQEIITRNAHFKDTTKSPHGYPSLGVEDIRVARALQSHDTSNIYVN